MKNGSGLIMPKIRLLPGKVERDRWLNREEAERLIAVAPDQLAALIRFALATGSEHVR